MSCEQQQRAKLLATADQDKAIELANSLINGVNDQLNEAGLSAATSLLARALAARGIAQIAGLWWSDMTGLPKPVTVAAINNLIADPPVFYDETLFDTRTGKELPD